MTNYAFLIVEVAELIVLVNSELSKLFVKKVMELQLPK